MVKIKDMKKKKNSDPINVGVKILAVSIKLQNVLKPHTAAVRYHLFHNSLHKNRSIKKYVELNKNKNHVNIEYNILRSVFGIIKLSKTIGLLIEKTKGAKTSRGTYSDQLVLE